MTQAIGRLNPFRKSVLRSGAAAALLAGLGMAQGIGAAFAAQTAAPASHWVGRKLDYTYMGFTAKYSCDGLRDTVRAVLLALGARNEDLQIQSTGCSNLNGPEPFPGVSARFSVLVPVTTTEIGKVGDTTAEPTQWQTVDLVRLNKSGFNLAPCELLEQLKEKALPLFTSRNLQFRSSCVPHQASIGQIQFTVDVLHVAPPPGAAPGPAT